MTTPDPALKARVLLGTAFTGAGIAHVVGLLMPTLSAAADQINHPEVLRRAGIPPTLAPVRVVAQILVVTLTWWSTRPSDERRPTGRTA